MSLDPTPLTTADPSRRHHLQRWVGAAGLAAGGWALAASSPASPAGSAPAAAARADPVKGDLIRWPSALALLDGRPWTPPAPGERATVVVFFSTTCPFCARHNVHVQKLLEGTRGQALQVLGVAHDRVEANVRTYLSRRGLGFDVTLEQGALHAALTRMPGIPITVVVDRQQRLREVIRGEMFEEDVLELAKWAKA